MAVVRALLVRVTAFVCARRIDRKRVVTLSRRFVASVASLSIVLQPALSAAQVYSNPSAPGGQQPQVLTAGNGVPVVNITTPNTAGVSMNSYAQFNVGPTGLVFNNGRTSTQTQLGGWIAGNPWLASGTARVIVNQVSGNAPSLLDGYMEIGGARADLVLANPSGISCNGCGFVNAARAVLTTGTPQFDSSGGLAGYEVKQGTVSVGGGGLDASTSDYASILARAVQVNASIWAKDLTVVTGSNQISTANRTATSISGTGDKPAFALDVAALGGMYAGKIKLIGTEAGVGVRNAGTIGAQAGELRLLSNGSVTNAGTMQASTRVRVRASGDVTNSGKIYGNSGTGVRATGTIDNAAGGAIASGGTTRLAGQVVRSRGVLAGGLNLDGTLAASGDLVVSATGLAALGGANVAAGAADIRAASIDISGSPNTYGAASLTLAASNGDLVAANAMLGTGGLASLTASGAIVTDGATATVGLLNLAGASLSNDRGTIAQSGTGTAQIAISSALANASGTIVANGPMSLAAATLSSSGSLVSAGTLAFSVGTLSNGGQIRSLADLSLSATGDIVNSGTIHAVGNATLLTSGGQIVNTASGLIGSEANATLGAASIVSNGVLGAGLRLDGTIGASGTLFLSAVSTAAIHGEAVAPTSLGIVANAIDVSGSPNVFGGGALVLQATSGDIAATGATIASQGLALFQATGALALDSANVVVGTLNVFGDRLSTNGAVIEQASTAPGQIVLSQAFDTGSGAVLSNGPLTIQTTSLTSSGTLVSAGPLKLVLASLDNSGSIRSLDQLDLSASGTVGNTGTLYGATSGRLVAGGALDNGASGLIASAGNVSIIAPTLTQSGLLAAGLDSAGKLGTSGDLTLTISGQATASGSTVAAGKMSLRADGISIASAPRVFAGSDLTLIATSGAIDATAASVASSGTLTLSTPGAATFDRAVVLADRLFLSAASLSNRQGSFQQAGTGAGSIALAGALDNTNGQIVSNGSLTIGADAITNTGGRIAAAHLLDVTANTLSGDGSYVSLGDLGLTTPGGFTNTGTIQAGGSALLQFGGTLLNSSTIVAGGTLVVGAPTIVNDPTGQITGGAVGLFTRDFTNNQGSVGANGNLMIAADSHGALANSILNDRGQIQSTSGDVVLLANGVQNLGTAPTFNHNASQLVFYTSGASPPGDPPGLLNFMLLPNVLAANNQPAPAYAAAYAKAFEELMAGKPLTADARAILDPSYVDAGTGFLTSRYAPSWAQFVAAGSSAGQSNMTTFMKNMVDPTLFDSQGNILPAAASAYAAFWIELSGGTALTSDVKAILKPSVLAADGSLLATYTSVWSSIDAPSATPFTIKKVITSDTLNNDGKMALIAAGGSISIAGGPVENLYSAISAGKDLNIAASTFHNVALGASQTQFEVWKSSPCYSCHNAQIKFGQSFGGIVEAGGNVSISTQGSFVSETVPTSSTGVQDLAVISTALAAQVQNLQPSLQATPASNVATFDRLGVADFAGVLQGTGSTSGLPSNGAVGAAIDYAQSLGNAAQPTGAPASGPSQLGGFLSGLGVAPTPTGSGAPSPAVGPTGIAQTAPGAAIAAQQAEAQFFTDANDFAHTNAGNRDLMQSSQPALAKSSTDSINALAWLANSAGAPSSNALFAPPKANALSSSSGGALISGNGVTLASGAAMSLDGVVDARTGLGLTSDADVMISGYVHGGASAQIAAGGNLVVADTSFDANSARLSAARDLSVSASQLQTTGDLSLAAGHDLSILSKTIANNGVRGGGTYSTTMNVASSLAAGGNLVLSAGNDLNVQGSGLTAGGAALVSAGGDLSLSAVHDELTYNQPVSANYANYALSRTIGASINAAGGLTLVTDKDFAAEAAQVKAGGTLGLLARGSVTIGAGEDETMSETMSTKKSSGFLSSKKTTDYEYADVKSSVASAFSGETVNVAANGDLTLTGSSIVGTGNLALAAGGAIDILAAQDITTTESIRTKKVSGLMGAVDGGFGFSIGTKKSNDSAAQTTTSNIASLVGSLGGDVTVAAGGDLTSTGSMIEALAGDLSLSGQNLALAAAVDTSQSSASHSESFSGLSVSIGGGAGNPLVQAQQAANFLSAASKTKDSQARFLYETAAALQAVQGVQNLAASGLASLESIGIKIGFGSQSSRSQSWQTSEQASGGQAIAGGTLDMQASGDLALTGATVKAADVLLAAERDLVLRSLALTDTSATSFSASSSFVGISLDLSLSKGIGVGVFANASGAQGSSQSTQTDHAQTSVTGTNSVDLVAGRDATLAGAEVLGGAITAAIGRDLTIVSDQDSASQSASQSSWSAGGSIGVAAGGGVSGSASYSQNQGKASGSYLSVTTPSGLFAGAGGFDVSVGGTTALTGAALASEADAAQNILTTGALITANLQNAASWSATSSGFGVSLSTSGSLASALLGGIRPALPQNQSGSSSGAAAATIAPGTVTILDPAAQKALTGLTPDQALAALDRAASAQNQAATALPGLSQILQDQADRSASFAAASSATANLVGTYASQQADAAKATVDALTKLQNETGSLTPDQQQQLADAQAQFKAWDEGGSARVLLHGLTQGLLAGIGGGGAGAATAASVEIDNRLSHINDPLDLAQSAREQALQQALIKAEAEGLCPDGACPADLIAAINGAIEDASAAGQSSCGPACPALVYLAQLAAATAAAIATWSATHNIAADISKSSSPAAGAAPDPAGRQHRRPPPIRVRLTRPAIRRLQAPAALPSREQAKVSLARRARPPGTISRSFSTRPKIRQH